MVPDFWQPYIETPLKPAPYYLQWDFLISVYYIIAPRFLHFLQTLHTNWIVKTQLKSRGIRDDPVSFPVAIEKKYNINFPLEEY